MNQTVKVRYEMPGNQGVITMKATANDEANDIIQRAKILVEKRYGTSVSRLNFFIVSRKND
jgi:hypothetical protein